MCLCCDGLMVFELFEDFEGLSSDYEFAGWRCINCGAIVDPVIAAHRHITSQVTTSDPALTSYKEASFMHILVYGGAETSTASPAEVDRPLLTPRRGLSPW